MHLVTNKNFILQNKKQYDSNKFIAANKHPQINFTSSFQKLIDSSKNTSYTQYEKIAQTLDGILGEDRFFSTAVKKAGLEVSNNTLILKNEGFVESLIKTIRYPIFDMPRDIANWLLKCAQKTPFKNTAANIAKLKPLQARAQAVEAEKNTQIVLELLDAFSKTASSNNFNIEKCAENFRADTAYNITNLAKNYTSRDERTLNRISTSLVSATFSARDFYNISMLQKNDKKEAKTAEKGRFKQEIARLLINASLTFLSLGVLEKYVSKNIFANAGVIALSALMGEVGSRLISKTPLLPLSPEQAASFAEKKAEDKEKNKVEQDDNDDDDDDKEEKEQNQPLTFSNSHKKVFLKFAAKDGSFAPIKALKEHRTQEAIQPPKKEEKKGPNILKTMGWLSLGSSLLYLLFEVKKGTYSSGLAKRSLLKNNPKQLEKILNDSSASISTTGENAAVIRKIKQIYSNDIAREAKGSAAQRIKRFLTIKKTPVDIDGFRKQIKGLKATSQGAKISQLLDEYLEKLDIVEKSNPVLFNKKQRFLIPGLYEGVTKIFKMLYQIMSLPGALINTLIEKSFLEESTKTFDKTVKKLGLENTTAMSDKYQKELGALYDIFEKFAKEPNKEAKIVEQIKKNTRTFDNKIETGELASISRTMVTLIGSYFFVNDYRNKVLIESKGKDIKKANEERNDRIVHKLSNFIINGTLMNVFNSVFKVPLNNSLFSAALIASATEMTNETLVRKSICQPIRKMKSKEDIINYEEKQLNKKGFMGWWTRTFMKITGKKSLTQKADIKTQKTQENKK